MGAIPDVAGVAASLLAPTEMAGARPSCGDVAPVRGPVTPVPRPPLVFALGLRPLPMGRLEEGGDTFLKAVLAMAPLPSAPRRKVDARPTPRIRMVIRLGRVAGEPGVNVLGSPFQAAPPTTITSCAACAGRPEPTMVKTPREAYEQRQRIVRAARRVARVAVRGASSPGLVAGTPSGAVALAPLVVPAGTMAIARAAIGPSIGATLRRARAGAGETPTPFHGPSDPSALAAALSRELREPATPRA